MIIPLHDNHTTHPDTLILPVSNTEKEEVLGYFHRVIFGLADHVTDNVCHILIKHCHLLVVLVYMTVKVVYP